MSTERQIGFASGPIPVSKIVEYGKEAELDPIAFSIVKHIVRELDDEYLLWIGKEKEKNRKKA